MPTTGRWSPPGRSRWPSRRWPGPGVGRLAFVRDQNGARVELLQREVDFRTEPGEDDLVRSFDYYSVRADDLACARDASGVRRGGLAILSCSRIGLRLPSAAMR